MVAPEPADLEISLRRRDNRRYTVELIFNRPDSAAAIRPLAQQVVTVSFNEEALRATWPDAAAYGSALGKMLFAPAELLEAFQQARAAAASLSRPLRLRVTIGADAPELQSLVWEALWAPGDRVPLALSEQILFARVLGSPDWHPISLRARGSLRALVAIAGPDGLARFGLAPIDVPDERRRAEAALGALPTTILSGPGEASLSSIAEQLREGFDIFYLVAHGTLVDGEPWIFLDDGHNQAAHIAGAELVARLADLIAPPRLVLFVSCRSAGDRTCATLTALGPRLVVAGVPAVIAMQGDFSADTHARFTPTFFRELQRDGQIDRAVAVARQGVIAQPDWWAPALFTRLRSGRIWYEPGFDEQDFQKWPTLLTSITHGRCTPILGPGLLDSLIGSSRDLAHQLADTHHFPLAPFARDDLPQVAQYLAVKEDIAFMREELAEAIRRALAARPLGAGAGPIDEALADAGARDRAARPNEPHGLLARLPFTIYLTANADRLLGDALRAADRKPQELICPWNRHGERLEAALEPPSYDQPLVYHLFGRLNDPESLVLTEDDYFRYLIGVTRNQDLLPREVGSALANTALLFLGFRLEDWNFRVLFQSVMNLEGAKLRQRYTHVAVQIDPQESFSLDPRAAREYLKTYFGLAAALNYQINISIYWGSAEDFLCELAEHYARVAGQA